MRDWKEEVRREIRELKNKVKRLEKKVLEWLGEKEGRITYAEEKKRERKRQKKEREK